jgi:hypothetical protein
MGMNVARLYAEKLCPVCGFKLSFTPWENPAIGQHCPCCGMHFGLDDMDESRREQTYVESRMRWIKMGRLWWSRQPQPEDYNPVWQIARLEHFANLPPE